MSKAFVYNHEYHQKYRTWIDFSDSLSIKIGGEGLRDVCPLQIHVKMVEEVSVLKRRRYLRITLVKLVERLEKVNSVYICGCQDMLSWAIYRHAKENEKEVHLIPDNLEFYLRPALIEKIKLRSSLKGMMKIISLGLFWEFIRKEVALFGSRVVFSIDNRDIASDVGFFIRSKAATSKNSSKKRIFISQPYYLDYAIDTELWNRQVIQFLGRKNVEVGDMKIKYHPRDTMDYKKSIQEKGYLPFGNHSIDSGIIVFGLFSTYLVELALEGAVVYSGYSEFSYLFPPYYSKFVEHISDVLKLDITSEKPWNLTKEHFNDILL